MGWNGFNCHLRSHIIMAGRTTQAPLCGWRGSRAQIKSLIEDDILPFLEVVNVSKHFKGARRNPGDDKFISCAISASADCIVTGDEDLFDSRKYQSVRIIHASDFIKMYD